MSTAHHAHEQKLISAPYLNACSNECAEDIGVGAEELEPANAVVLVGTEPVKGKERGRERGEGQGDGGRRPRGDGDGREGERVGVSKARQIYCISCAIRVLQLRVSKNEVASAFVHPEHS